MQNHYYLIAGNVVYQPLSVVGQPENPMGIMTLNSVIQSPTPTFAVQSIARAQQSLQQNFYKKTEDGSLKIIDVIITNISYLGLMTEEEFHAVPVGTKEQKHEGE